ncbi:unnamed protein product, partial [Closterium sp. NIES-54]
TAQLSFTLDSRATTCCWTLVAGSGATSQTAQLSFTLDSRASSCFFRDCTDLTPLRTPVTVALADAIVRPVVAHSTTTLPCSAAPFGFLIGYYTPSFSRNLMGVSHLHDLGVVTTFPQDKPVASCTLGATGAPLATFHKEEGSGLYSLHTGSHHTGSGQVRLGQVAAVSCDYRSLTHPSVHWQHRLCYLLFPRLHRMVRHRGFRSPRVACPTSSHACAAVHSLRRGSAGPSPIIGPRQECYFLIGLDDYSCYTTVLPLRRKANVPTVLEPGLLARGGAQGMSSPQQNRIAERHIGMVMEVARTSMCHAGAHPFLWPQGVRYAAHLLNLWPSDARPRVTLVSLWTGSLSVAANFRGWGSLAHVRTLGANMLSPRTHVCVFLGFPLDASGWVFYDLVTFNPPPPPPPSCPALSSVSHVTPQSSPPLRPVPIVSGGAGGAVAESEGTGAARAGGVGSGGAGGVGLEVTLVEDTAASSRRPRLASPLGFPSVPQFPPRSSLRPVVAECGGVPAGGTEGPGGVSGGGAGARGTGTVAPTL